MTTLAPTLSTRYFSRTAAWLRDVFLITLSILLIATLAQVKIPIPFTPVPLTGQTFAVLLVGAALGSKRGAISLVLYTLMGALGLPFFAGGASGLAYLSGPTLGYLVGFIAAAYVIGLLAERGLERSVRTSLIPFVDPNQQYKGYSRHRSERFRHGYRRGRLRNPAAAVGG